MKEKKKVKYCEKYKTEYGDYIVIILILAIIRFVPISLGSSEFNDAINDLAVGGCASALVALLLDAADCRKKNRELHEKQRMIFAEYCNAINDLGYFIANQCKDFSQDSDELDIKSWLDKLSNKNNYTKDISLTLRRFYLHIESYTRNVKSTLVLLRQQYCVLIDSDMIDTDDLRQHIALQVRICDEICDVLELNIKDFSNVVNLVNENLIQLHNHATTFFPEGIPEMYSWNTKG